MRNFEYKHILQAGNVPSIKELIKLDKQLQQKQGIGNTVMNSSQATLNQANWATPDVNNDAQPKKAKQNLHVKDKNETTVRAKLLKFYEIYNPAKLQDKDAIDELLKRYQGRDKQLFNDLEKKYILGGPKSSYKRKKISKKPISRSDIIMKTLWKLYERDIRAAERDFKFPEFHTPLLDEVDFLAKPMVLLVGQYSVGKTSFIRYLVGRDFPGIRVGPEPTTGICYT